MTTASRSAGRATLSSLSRDPDDWSVVWTRGEGCNALATMIADGVPKFAGADPRDACLEARADVIVQRRLTSFDLVSVAVPRRFRPDAIGSVVAVAGGSHAELAARVARKIASASGTEAMLISVSRGGGDDPGAQLALDRTDRKVPGLTPALVRADSALALLSAIEPDSVLVVGAPGGSWLQRQMFGPGPRLRHVPSGGVVVVRGSPSRCFQRTHPGVVISPWLHVKDARRLMVDAVVPVVDAGLLVGIVRRDVLMTAPDDVEVATLAEEPVFVTVDDPIEAAADLSGFLEGAPVPVVDDFGRYVGNFAP